MHRNLWLILVLIGLVLMGVTVVLPGLVHTTRWWRSLEHLTYQLADRYGWLVAGRMAIMLLGMTTSAFLIAAGVLLSLVQRR